MSEKSDTPRVNKLIDDMLHDDGVPRCDEWDRLEVLARQLERERDQAVELLTDARLQLEYLRDKFPPTSSGEAVISRINDFLSSLKG